MKLLTDTHTLVWALPNSEALGTKAREALSTEPVTVSVVNLWELVLKSGRPGALLADPVAWWDHFISGSGLSALPVRTSHLRMLAKLPEYHKDPFDRLLIAQALEEGFTLVSKDAVIARYDVPLLW